MSSEVQTSPVTSGQRSVNSGDDISRMLPAPESEAEFTPLLIKARRWGEGQTWIPHTLFVISWLCTNITLGFL